MHLLLEGQRLALCSKAQVPARRGKPRGRWTRRRKPTVSQRDERQTDVFIRGVSTRVYVMSLREERMKQGIRRFLWIPTTAMLADSLTKQMISNIMYDLLHFGFWQFDNSNQNPLMAMELQLSDIVDAACLSVLLLNCIAT